jgi:transcriptional antiterminator NusG
MEQTKLKDAKWYALRVVSGKEKKAIENLEFELKVNNLDRFVSNLLLPMETEFKLRNGKKVSREKLTFPGYLLLEAELNGELERTVKRTNFVIEFTGDKGRPTPLKQREIDRIIGKIEDDENREEIPFVVGEFVDIIDGPFNTFKGEITHIDEAKQTLKVNVSIFGRVTPVDLSYLQVDKEH